MGLERPPPEDPDGVADDHAGQAGGPPGLDAVLAGQEDRRPGRRRQPAEGGHAGVDGDDDRAGAQLAQGEPAHGPVVGVVVAADQADAAPGLDADAGEGPGQAVAAPLLDHIARRLEPHPTRHGPGT